MSNDRFDQEPTFGVRQTGLAGQNLLTAEETLLTVQHIPVQF
jgi:hypothetical protein